ncbi:hypothetical protein F4811DRAFT_553376 [Daldinia bambusicola]|nr:hypothetical protein F4811DRAFT_553376 [Daldinia bambusicola]
MVDDHENEHEGASVEEQLIEACRRDNVDLLEEIVSRYKSTKEISDLLNNTTTVMGNHLYHEAALQGNYDVIDFLLDQPDFECDPINRVEGDTPLHSAIRWINSEPPAQRDFGDALVLMMLEAGSSTRLRNKANLTPYQLVDPSNPSLRAILLKHEYAQLNAGDFVDSGSNADADAENDKKNIAKNIKALAAAASSARYARRDDGDDGDDADFSGSDEEERAEWERTHMGKGR